MAHKSHGDSHSQTLGILWISIGLLLIGLVAIFSSRKGSDTLVSDSVTDSLTQILAFHEDSVYRHKTHRQYPPQNLSHQHSQQLIDSNWYDNRPTPARQPLSVELNSADSVTLQLLHGIGPAYARRIVNYRDRLGGFVSTTQLLEVYGFGPELWKKFGMEILKVLSAPSDAASSPALTDATPE